MLLTHAVNALETPGAEGSDPLAHMGCDVPQELTAGHVMGMMPPDLLINLYHAVFSDKSQSGGFELGSKLN